MSTTFSNALFAQVGTADTVTTSATATAVNGHITVASTTGLLVNMPIVFTGTTIGGIVSGTVYFITAVGTNYVTISATSGGTNFALTAATGTMTVTAGGPTPVVSSSSNSRVTVIGLSIANVSGNLVLVTVQLVDGNNNNNTANYAYQVPLPANQSMRLINGGERLVLGPSMTVTVSSTVESSIDVALSYVVIQ